MVNSNAVAAQKLQRYKEHWILYLFSGLLLMVLGIIGAIYATTITTFAMFWIGILLIIAGIFQFFSAFRTKEKSGMIINAIVGIIALLVGVYFLTNPTSASMILTLVIGCALIVIGLLRIIFSLQMREAAIWWLILFAGIISVLLGLFILLHWPVSGLWIIGFFISIEIFLAGWSMLIMSVAAKTQL